MKILIVFLVLAACTVSTPIGIYNRGNSKLQTDGKFFHKIGDWFDYLKNRIHETLFGQAMTTTASLLSTEIFNLDNFQLQQILNTREWFLLDLNNLTFDPDHDLGFRIGNWYIIRKRFKDDRFGNNFDELDFPSSQTTIQSMDSTELNIEETFETMIDLMTTEISPIVSTSTEDKMPSVTEETSIRITTQNTIQTSSVESSSLRTDKWVEDDETTKESTPKGSAEVLMG